MPLSRKSFYSDDNGGHAHDDLREAFLDAIDAVEHWEKGQPEPTVELRNQEIRVSEVFKLLLTCTDSLSGMAWDWFMIGDQPVLPDEGVDLPDSYGKASRFLLANIDYT